jgi:hypothetical protein
MCAEGSLDRAAHSAGTVPERASGVGDKRLTFRSAAREKILRGGAQLADAVRITLGPGAKSVLTEKKWGKPAVDDHGVTIAREAGRIALENALSAASTLLLTELPEKTPAAKNEMPEME